MRENGNGTCEALAFDREDRLAGRVTWRGDRGAERSTTWGVRYVYDPEGLLQETLDSERGATRYTYDPDQRLVGQQGPGSNQFDYRYDNAGNLSYAPTHFHIERHPDNLLSHTHLERFEYDSRRRIAKRIRYDGAEVTYAYDSADQLIGASFSDRPETWQAAYDGCGRRLWREFAGERTNFYWDEDRLAAEVDPSGALRIYVYANVDTLVPFMWLDYASVDAASESGVAHYLFCAPTGMPLRVEDAAGRVEWSADSPEPYGHLGASGEPAPLRLRFAGHFHEEYLDLFYNRFRDYDPKLGRYLQRDPLGHAGSANLYAYCANPVVDVDLRGLLHKAKKATKAEADTPGPTKPLAKGEKEELELPNGLRKVTTGDKGGGHTVRHYDENGNEVSVHKFNEHGQLTHAEMVVGPKSPGYEKQAKRHTPEDMGRRDQRGHAGPEVHTADQRAANTPENMLAEHQASNQGPKKRFENGVPNAVDANPGEVRTVHDYDYPNDETKRPSSSSHGITANGERLPEHNTGPIPNSAAARNTTLQSER